MNSLRNSVWILLIPAVLALALSTTWGQPGATGPGRDLSPLANQRGISYGPFRDGQAPGAAQPSIREMREDLHLLANRWGVLRIYGSDPFARQICEVISEDRLDLRVMIGAWLGGPGSEAANLTQVSNAIEIANDFPDVVCAVSVGNETQVFWSFHKVPTEQLISHIRQARAQTKVPVTVADDFLFWADEASKQVAAEIDFIVTHIYAMWHAQPLEKAIPFTDEKFKLVKEMHPDKLIVLGEAGWATEKSKSGEQADRLLGVAGEPQQKQFYEQFTAWAEKNEVSTFYFSAFDENWKGGDDPNDAEKHWGLYHADRTPKAALAKTSAEPSKAAH